MEKDYRSLYIKYKNKYINLKNQITSDKEEQTGGAEKKDVILFKAEIYESLYDGE